MALSAVNVSWLPQYCGSFILISPAAGISGSLFASSCFLPGGDSKNTDEGLESGCHSGSLLPHAYRYFSTFLVSISFLDCHRLLSRRQYKVHSL